MKFIEVGKGHVINTRFLREISFVASQEFDEERQKRVVIGYEVFADIENRNRLYLKFFDTREQAQAYVTELVAKINGEDS